MSVRAPHERVAVAVAVAGDDCWPVRVGVGADDRAGAGYDHGSAGTFNPACVMSGRG